MAFGVVALRPGVNTQKTLASNEAGVSVSNLIRYKDQLIQKYGGWDQYFSGTFSSTIREIHGWEGNGGAQFLAVGTTMELAVITLGSLSDITPQTRTSNPAPNFSVSSGSNIVTVVDPGSSVSTYDTVYFNTPVAVGPLLINGSYKVNTVGGSSSYTILSSNISSVAVVSSGVLPAFTTSSGSAIVDVTLPNNNFLSIAGLFYPFIAPTPVGGLTIQGNYLISAIIDSTHFQIITATQASSAATASMNGGLAQIVYYVTIGPPPSAGGYGIGGYGLGGYGVGSPVAGGGGTPITATDWTMDNWGEILLACPTDGPVYAWSPDSGFTTAQVVTTAPFFNGGLFISMPQQILVLWRSTLSTGAEDNLIVRWSDAGDYTNFAVTSQTAAGSFHIPTGSMIKGGLQGSSQGYIWTDVDLWAMSYIGGDLTFNFTRIGSGCGLIGPHAAGVIAGNVFWCGTNNFFTTDANGVHPLPCTVWDFVFQNLDTNNVDRIRCAPNSTFNEISWFFPTVGGNGENNAYVKLNIIEGEWDYGLLARASWIDVTALGNPIGTDTTTIYQHEIGFNNVNQPIDSVFESGYWSIAQGEELVVVDWFLPDMKFGTYSGSQTASVLVTFKVVDYPGDAPRVYGPFTFTNATQYLSPRFRGRFMAIRIESVDTNSFWRIGSCRYRYAISGRR